MDQPGNGSSVRESGTAGSSNAMPTEFGALYQAGRRPATPKAARTVTRWHIAEAAAIHVRILASNRLCWRSHRRAGAVFWDCPASIAERFSTVPALHQGGRQHSIACMQRPYPGLPLQYPGVLPPSWRRRAKRL